MFLSLFIVFYQISVFAGSKEDLEKGIELFNVEKYAEAKEIFTNIVDKDSKNPEAWYYLGRLCFVDKEYDKAIKWFKKAVKLNKDSSEYHFWLGNAYGERIQRVGKIKQAFMATKWKKAWLKAVELDADNIDARFSLMQYYLNAPAIAGGSKEKAHEQSKEIKKRDPKMGHEAYINVYNAEEKYELVEKEYFALIETDPQNYDYHIRLAWLYINTKDYEKAYKKLIKMIEDYPEKSGSYYSIGHIANESDKYLEHAEEYMLKFFKLVSSEIENHPKSRIASWHYVFGTIYKKNGKNDLAKKEYEIALNLNPEYKEAKEALKNM